MTTDAKGTAQVLGHAKSPSTSYAKITLWAGLALLIPAAIGLNLSGVPTILSLSGDDDNSSLSSFGHWACCSRDCDSLADVIIFRLAKAV